MKKSLILSLLFVFLLTGTSYSLQLLNNGDFSNGLTGWTDGQRAMASWDTYSGVVSIVDDGPYSDSLQHYSVNGWNYYSNIYQDINISNPYDNYLISFDWKVTQKESTYGANYITFHFYDATDNRLGGITYIDTANSGHTPSYLRGGLSENELYVNHRYLQLFDWEHVELNTRDIIPDLDYASISKITVASTIQNDASRGGVMLVDNMSVQVVPTPEPSTILLLGGGLAGLAWYGRKRKKM